MPCEDPGLNERFLREVLGFKTAERVVTSIDGPEVICALDELRRITTRHGVPEGPQRQAAPLRLSPEDRSAILSPRIRARGARPSSVRCVPAQHFHRLLSAICAPTPTERRLAPDPHRSDGNQVIPNSRILR
jgi:hypothetical protein